MRRKVKLDGALVVVTGAGSGIGRAAAAAFARSGSKIVALDIDEATAKASADACLELGVEAVGYQCDVADRDAVVALAEQVRRDHGVPDVLINNAGVGMSGRFADMSLDDWEWIRSINLDGVVHGCHAFGPAMLERGSGHVVNTSSGLAYLPRSSEVAYCTTKAAVLMFSRSLRADWRRRGVSVSAVCPGVINTPIIDGTRFLGDMGSPRAVAAVKRGFSTFGHSPELVADAMLTAVRRDRAIVAPGIESRLGWHIAKVTPVALTDHIGRPVPRILTKGLRK